MSWEPAPCLCHSRTSAGGVGAKTLVALGGKVTCQCEALCEAHVTPSSAAPEHSKASLKQHCQGKHIHLRRRACPLRCIY